MWRLVEEFDAGQGAGRTTRTCALRHKTIKRVTADLERMQFNTAIAAMMEYVNELGTGKGATREDLVTLVKLVGPYAPHLGDEAWEKLGGEGLPDRSSRWPSFDDALTRDAVVTLGDPGQW